MGVEMTTGQKILIVDDKKANLVALRQVLRQVEAVVIEAESGNEALAATLDHDFAVAILDVQMPGMTGYELAAYLRGDLKTRLIPIIFLTAAYYDDEHVFKGYAAGGVDYLTKPYLPEILVGKVKIFLEMDSYRRELELHRDHLEALVAARTADLSARLKELQCLYAIASLAAESGLSIDEMLQAAVGLIPAGWQYPEIACARITYAGREFSSPMFRRTDWRQAVDLTTHDSAAATLEVCYLEERAASDEGPFLKEERELLNTLGRQLGLMIERQLAVMAIRELNQELEQRVGERTRQLERRNYELEQMNKVFVGRELRMAELKERIAALEKKNGQ